MSARDYMISRQLLGPLRALVEAIEQEGIEDLIFDEYEAAREALVTADLDIARPTRARLRDLEGVIVDVDRIMHREGVR